MARLKTATGELETIDVPFAVEYPSYGSLHVDGRYATYIGSSPTSGAVVVRLDVTTGTHEVLRRSGDVPVDEGYISVARPVEYPTANDLTAHAYFYPPVNQDYTAPEGELPH
ncbi:MAG: hypothetical protein R3C44_02250 [Chloroflexota bacterium]